MNRRCSKLAESLVVVMLGACFATTGGPHAGAADPSESIRKDIAGGVVDRYGGRTDLKHEATGFFRIDSVGRRTMLLTPEGHAYFALGANHVTRYMREQSDRLGWLTRFNGDVDRAWDGMFARMNDLGLNAGEAYAPISERTKRRLPYLANLTFPVPSKFAFDIFDNAVVETFERSITRQSASIAEDPMVIGIVFADLPVWDERRVRFFESLPFESPGRVELDAFRRDGKTDDQFLAHVADRFYRVLRRSCRRGAPNHLMFGERFRLRGAPDEVIAAVGPHIDALCTQALILSPHRPPEWQVFDAARYRHEHRLAGKPMVMVDWASPFSITETFRTERGEIREETMASEQAARWLEACTAEPYMLGIFKCQLLGLHANDRWFDGRARRTYFRDDGTDFPVRTEITRQAHRRVLDRVYRTAGDPRPDAAADAEMHDASLRPLPP